LFVSGGNDGRLLLWPTNKAVDEKWTPNPTEMNTKLEDSEVVLCLAASPDNKRIFSGGSDDNLTIHDANT
jgi:WD40 repeat protein